MHSALVALAVLTCTAAVGAEPQLRFEKYRLENGLTVILSEDHRLPHVAVNVWYHVGAANQRPGRSGFAHLFEHMMFAGSEHVGANALQLFEQVGARVGSAVNGTTSFDRTNYFEVIPSSELPLALWVESDRMGYLTLDAEKLRIQRDVVSNERRQSYENQPYGKAQLRLCDLLYPKPHPYFECVIGEISDIQAGSVEDVREFFRQFYPASNASIAIVGDFDPPTAKALIARYFGTLPRREEPPKPSAALAPIAGTVQERVEDELVRVPRLSLVWRGVTPYAKDEPAGDVAAYVLALGRSSRLYRDLVLEREAASSVSASNASLRLSGFFQLNVTARADKPIEGLREALLQHVARLRDEGPTPQELERAKRQLVASRLRQVERIGGFGGKADLFNEYEMFVGDPGHLPKDLAALREVTSEDVKAFVQRYLGEARLELWVVPAAKKVTP